MNNVIKETERIIEMQPKINSALQEINNYTDSYNMLKKDNQKYEKEIESLKLKNEKLEKFFDDLVCDDEEWFDAMYYAAKDKGNDDVLAHWENYFKDLLLYDEKYNYASDCGGYDCKIC